MKLTVPQRALQFRQVAPCTGSVAFQLLRSRLHSGICLHKQLECPNCAADVSIDQLLFGLDPRTQDLVLAKLDRIDRNTQEGFQELRALIQRQFLQEFKREQKYLESYCPNLFVLQPDNRSRWHQDIGSSRINLQLYCLAIGHVDLDGYRCGIYHERRSFLPSELKAFSTSSS